MDISPLEQMFFVSLFPLQTQYTKHTIEASNESALITISKVSTHNRRYCSSVGITEKNGGRVNFPLKKYNAKNSFQVARSPPLFTVKLFDRFIFHFVPVRTVPVETWLI